MSSEFQLNFLLRLAYQYLPPEATLVAFRDPFSKAALALTVLPTRHLAATLTDRTGQKHRVEAANPIATDRPHVVCVRCEVWRRSSHRLTIHAGDGGKYLDTLEPLEIEIDPHVWEAWWNFSQEGNAGLRFGVAEETFYAQAMDAAGNQELLEYFDQRARTLNCYTWFERDRYLQTDLGMKNAVAPGPSRPVVQTIKTTDGCPPEPPE